MLLARVLFWDVRFLDAHCVLLLGMDGKRVP